MTTIASSSMAAIESSHPLPLSPLLVLDKKQQLHPPPQGEECSSCTPKKSGTKQAWIHPVEAMLMKRVVQERDNAREEVMLREARLQDLCRVMQLLTKCVSTFPSSSQEETAASAKQSQSAEEQEVHAVENVQNESQEEVQEDHGCDRTVENHPFLQQPAVNPSPPTKTTTKHTYSNNIHHHHKSMEHAMETLLLKLHQPLYSYTHHPPTPIPSTGYTEASTLYNACLRIKENLHQTSLESNETLHLLQTLQTNLLHKSQREAHLERALCKLYRENLRLKTKLSNRKKKQTHVVRLMKTYMAAVQNKCRLLEEEVTKTNLLMHEYTMTHSAPAAASASSLSTPARKPGDTAGEATTPTTTASSFVSPSSAPAPAAAAATMPDVDDTSSIVSFSSTSSMSTAASTFVTEEGMATVRFHSPTAAAACVNNSNSSSSSRWSESMTCDLAEQSTTTTNDATNPKETPSSSSTKMGELLRKSKQAASLPTHQKERPTYTLTFSAGKPIGLQLQRIPIASIPRSILVEGQELEQEEDEDAHNSTGMLLQQEQQERHHHHQQQVEEEECVAFLQEEGPWNTPKSRTSTFDEEDEKWRRHSSPHAALHSSPQQSSYPQHPYEVSHATTPASSPHPPLAPYAFLVSGYPHFDSHAHVRPPIGSRLVAMNGESLEWGPSWTFQDLRDKLQASSTSCGCQEDDKSNQTRVELIFRKDPLSRRQKELLDKAVASDLLEKEKNRNSSSSSSSSHNKMSWRMGSASSSLDAMSGDGIASTPESEAEPHGKDDLRQRMRKFSEDIFHKSSSSFENPKEKKGGGTATATTTTSLSLSMSLSSSLPPIAQEKETISVAAAHKTSAESVKEKMRDLFKSSSSTSPASTTTTATTTTTTSDVGDGMKQVMSSSSSSFSSEPTTTMPPSQKNNTNTTSADGDLSVKLRMKKISEGFSSTFHHALDHAEDTKKKNKKNENEAVVKPSTCSTSTAFGGDGKTVSDSLSDMREEMEAVKAKLSKFEFTTPSFKKFF